MSDFGTELDETHPRGFFTRYFKMYSDIKNVQQIKVRDIFTTMALRKIGEVYGGREYSRTLGLQTGTDKQKTPLRPSLIKILNPLNIPLMIVKVLGMVIVTLANKIPSKIVKNTIIAVLCTPLFIIDSFLDLFNKTPSQLYERWQTNKALRKQMQEGYSLDSGIEAKPLLEHEVETARIVSTKKPSIQIDITLSNDTIKNMKELADACTYKKNLDQIRNLITEIKKDPGYQKYVTDYRKEEQYLRDVTSINVKTPPTPQTNLTSDQIMALSAIHDLDEKLRGVKKIAFVNINSQRLEKAIEKIREKSINSVLQNFAVDTTQKEPRSKYST